MTTSIHCRRCLREAAPAISGSPYPGRLGEEIKAGVCADCWAEWRNAEVMVINELRLNFMDPKAQTILTEHMREFLALPPQGGTGDPSE